MSTEIINIFDDFWWVLAMCGRFCFISLVMGSSNPELYTVNLVIIRGALFESL